MSDEIKPGMAIPMSDELVGTIEEFADEMAALSYAMSTLAKRGASISEKYFRAVRETHPELDGWEFRVDADGKQIVVMFRAK